jgi:hypothetical protein
VTRVGPIRRCSSRSSSRTWMRDTVSGSGGGFGGQRVAQVRLGGRAERGQLGLGLLAVGGRLAPQPATRPRTRSASAAGSSAAFPGASAGPAGASAASPPYRLAVVGRRSRREAAVRRRPLDGEREHGERQQQQCGAAVQRVPPPRGPCSRGTRARARLTSATHAAGPSSLARPLGLWATPWKERRAAGPPAGLRRRPRCDRRPVRSSGRALDIEPVSARLGSAGDLARSRGRRRQ